MACAPSSSLFWGGLPASGLAPASGMILSWALSKSWMRRWEGFQENQGTDRSRLQSCISLFLQVTPFSGPQFPNV